MLLVKEISGIFVFDFAAVLVGGIVRVSVGVDSAAFVLVMVWEGLVELLELCYRRKIFTFSHMFRESKVPAWPLSNRVPVTVLKLSSMQ